MAKFICLLYTLNLFYLNTYSSLESKEFIPINTLPSGCEDLQLFANETAKFTYCFITNSQPITVCEDCVNEYNKVLNRYIHIQKLYQNDSMVNCRTALTNIQRLQVIKENYNYVLEMWENALCKLCYNNNGTILNDRIKQVIERKTNLELCIQKYINDTKSNSSLCTDCKTDYVNLINYYNTQKIKYEFCMDVVDMIYNVEVNWSSKCHVNNHKSEWLFFVISFIVLLMPILFYFINWFLSQERSHVLLSQNRWHERIMNSTASTSGYVIIS